MKKNSRNGIVSLWKFIFAAVIILFHTHIFYENDNIPFFKNSYIACEFFFVVAGFYFAKNVLKEKYNKETIGKDTFSFIWKKISSFLPYILISYILCIIFKLLNDKMTIDYLINSIWNPLLIKSFGFRGPLMISPIWFLTAMLTSMFFIYIASPLIVLFVLGYLSTIKVGLDFAYKEWIIFTRSGMLRGFAEINIGMILYLIHNKLESVKYTNIYRTFLTLSSNGSLIGILVITSIIKRSPVYDYAFLLLISISILIMTSEKTIEYKFLSNKFNTFLEKISMPMFISHVLFIDIFYQVSKFQHMEPLLKSLLSLLSTIVFSIIIVQIVELFQKKHIIKKITKKIVIKEG